MTASADNTAEREAKSGSTPVLTELDVYKLSILTGSQQGAVSNLHSLATISVGCALTNDIVLRDESVEQEHVSVTIEQNEVLVHCLSGTAAVDGININAGERSSFLHSGLVQIGNVALSIENEAHGMSQHLGQPSHAVNLDSVSTVEELEQLIGSDAGVISNTDTATDEHGNALLQIGAKKFGLGGSSSTNTVVATIAALLIGASIVWKSGLFERATTEPVALSTLLEASPFSGLVIEQNGNSALVSGFVKSRQESTELKQWLDSSGLHISNTVIVGDVLADQVLDVFRVHGVGAEVDVAAEGFVVVLTNEADTQLLDTINERVILDVPGIASLAIENTPPAVIAAEKTTKLDSGKRVAMVVSDSPAYIVTEDSSRYFVGSWLPTGHRIQSIVDGKVMLEKEGSETMLEF